MGIWHDRKATEVTVKTVMLEDSPAQVARAAGEDGGGKLGLVMRPLSPASKRSCTPRAGWWSRMLPDRRWQPDCRPGDVVLGVNGAGVATLADLKREVARAGHNVALLIQREDNQIYYSDRLGVKGFVVLKPRNRI